MMANDWVARELIAELLRAIEANTTAVREEGAKTQALLQKMIDDDEEFDAAC